MLLVYVILSSFQMSSLGPVAVVVLSFPPLSFHFPPFLLDFIFCHLFIYSSFSFLGFSSVNVAALCISGLSIVRL